MPYVSPVSSCESSPLSSTLSLPSTINQSEDTSTASDDQDEDEETTLKQAAHTDTDDESSISGVHHETFPAQEECAQQSEEETRTKSLGSLADHEEQVPSRFEICEEDLMPLVQQVDEELETHYCEVDETQPTESTQRSREPPVKSSKQGRQPAATETRGTERPEPQRTGEVNASDELTKDCAGTSGKNGQGVSTSERQAATPNPQRRDVTDAATTTVEGWEEQEHTDTSSVDGREKGEAQRDTVIEVTKADSLETKVDGADPVLTDGRCPCFTSAIVCALLHVPDFVDWIYVALLLFLAPVNVVLKLALDRLFTSGKSESSYIDLYFFYIGLLLSIVWTLFVWRTITRRIPSNRRYLSYSWWRSLSSLWKRCLAVYVILGLGIIIIFLLRVHLYGPIRGHWSSHVSMVGIILMPVPLSFLWISMIMKTIQTKNVHLEAKQ